MKKFLKNFLGFILSILIVTLNITVVYASSTNQQVSNKGKIITKKINQNLIDYANTQFKRHILIASRNSEEFGFEDEDVSEFILGHPFSVYEYDGDNLKDNQIYYFPVVSNNKIKAVLGVAYVNGEYHSTLQKAFAEELEKLITNKNSTFRIVNNEDKLKAISSSEEIVISKHNSNGIEIRKRIIHNEKSIKNDKISNDEVILDENDLKSPIENNKTSNDEVILDEDDLKSSVKQPKMAGYIPDGPYEYNSIPMKIVTQGNYNWCWAATCAGIINYLKGENLSAKDVVTYVYGSAVNEGGSWNEMKKAYNHWGLTPYQTDTMPYWQVKNNIDAMQPIHLGLNQGQYRHSVTLKGYEKYRDGNNLYILIDPNYSHVVTMDIKDDRNSMYYVLDGKLYFWNYSRLGF